MTNPILNKEDTQALADQFAELEKGHHPRVNSITVALQNGTSGTFTRTRDGEWQVTLSGRATGHDYFGR